MNVLIITRLDKSSAEVDALAEARSVLQGIDGAEVALDSELDWEQLRQVYGGYDGAYRHVAQRFDRVVVIEGPGRTLARGQTAIVEACLMYGTPAAVWRDGRGHRVQQVQRLPGNDWKGGYAAAVV